MTDHEVNNDCRLQDHENGGPSRMADPVAWLEFAIRRK